MSKELPHTESGAGRCSAAKRPLRTTSGMPCPGAAAADGAGGAAPVAGASSNRLYLVWRSGAVPLTVCSKHRYTQLLPQFVNAPCPATFGVYYGYMDTNKSW